MGDEEVVEAGVVVVVGLEGGCWWEEEDDMLVFYVFCGTLMLLFLFRFDFLVTQETFSPVSGALSCVWYGIRLLLLGFCFGFAIVREVTCQPKQDRV